MTENGARQKGLLPGLSSAAATSTALHVHVVEDHNEALAHIHRAIARRCLPFNGSILLHFDAHPDLLSPDIKVDSVSKKDFLYSKIDIADWILPALFMGHFESLIWIKPPWAQQIPEGIHQLHVGRDKTTGHIRVSTPLPYFISELLCVPESDLEAAVTVSLKVVTLYPLHKSFNKDDDDSTPLVKKMRLVGDSPCEGVAHSTPPHLEDIIMDSVRACKGWVLDIDLDFFSTGNPFRAIYSEEQFELLERLYHLEEPESNEPAAIDKCVRKRREQLSYLEKLWESPGLGQELGLDCKDILLVEEMKAMIGSIRDEAFVNAEYLHMSGMVTDLPIHKSSSSEISSLVTAVHKFLQRMNSAPSIITVSRSSEDDYTPPLQVEDIQEQVLATLQHLYGNQQSHDPLLIYHHYRHKSTPTDYESPKDICDCTYL